MVPSTRRNLLVAARATSRMPTIVIYILCIVVVLIIALALRIWFDLGLRSKMAVLFGLRFKHLESLRREFFPHSTERRSKVLLISFAGGALKFGGQTRSEFRKALSIFPADQLFLMDPAQSFYLQDGDGYWNGFEELSAFLTGILANYNSAILVGASMGATAALMFSHLEKVSRVVAFDPVIDPQNDSRFLFRVTSLRLPQRVRSLLPQLVQENVKLSRAVVSVHVSSSAADQMHSSLLPSNATVIVHENEEHKTATTLRTTGQLAVLLQKEYDLANAEQPLASDKEPLSGN